MLLKYGSAAHDAGGALEYLVRNPIDERLRMLSDLI